MQSCAGGGDGGGARGQDVVGAGCHRLSLPLAFGVLGGALVLLLLPPTCQASLQVIIAFSCLLK